jgi:hypothetical protein
MNLFSNVSFKLSLLIFFVSCVPSGTGDEAVFGKQFRIEYDQVIRLEDGTEITFLDLKKDTRCPEDALCLYNGEATILVALAREDKIGDVLDITIPGFVDRFSREGHGTKEQWDYRFTLLQLDPYPLPDYSEPKQQYVATILVERKGGEPN